MNDIAEDGAPLHAPVARSWKAHAVVEAPQRAAAGAVTPGELLRYALDSGADLDRLEKLMDLQMRFDDDQARKAFADDMARFKAMPIEIVKDKHVHFKTEKGTTSYWHATIGNVVERVTTALAQFGFSHRWDIEQKDGLVIVTCVITHRMGHTQTTMLKASPDSSGTKNGIQSIISTKTYLERHTLLAATGLATKDMEDDDGAGAIVTADERREMKQAAAETRATASPLLKRGQEAADKGHLGLGAFLRSITEEERRQLRSEMPALQERAQKAKAK